MGNAITFQGKNEDDDIYMSNGLTDVFIDIMLVCEYQMAKNESERLLMAFLSSKQQGIVGLGTVGFHIVEMPWNRASFDSDKKFLLRVIQNAKECDNWNILEYKPFPSHIMYALEGFHQLINRMSIQDIDDQNFLDWIEDIPMITRCDKHKIIVHKQFGCKLCNEIGEYIKS